jgi:hypothetical protein
MSTVILSIVHAFRKLGSRTLVMPARYVDALLSGPFSIHASVALLLPRRQAAIFLGPPVKLNFDHLR